MAGWDTGRRGWRGGAAGARAGAAAEAEAEEEEEEEEEAEEEAEEEEEEEVEWGKKMPNQRCFRGWVVALRKITELLFECRNHQEKALHLMKQNWVSVEKIEKSVQTPMK